MAVAVKMDNAVNMDSLYRLIFDVVDSGMALHRVIVNDDGIAVDYVFLDVNPAFEKMTGLKKNEILNKKVTEVLPGIDKSNFDWIERYGRVARTGQPTKFTEFSAPLGRWYSVKAFCPYPEYFVTIFNDVTEDMIHREELRISADWFKVLFYKAPDAYYLLEMDGTVINGNDAMEELSGFSREEFIGTNLFALGVIDCAQLGKLEKHFEANRNGLPAGPEEYVFTKKNGDRIEISARSLPVEWEGRHLILGIARDVSIRASMERKLREANSELNSFAGIVSHDLKSPLNNIKGLVEMAWDDPEYTAENMELIHSEAQRLLDFINSILAVSRAGLTVEHRVEIDLNNILESVYNAEKIGKCPSRLVISDPIPSIMGDFTRMDQVFRNLFSNSFKYRDDDKEELMIEVTFKIKDDFLYLSYRDNGMGISAENIDKVFCPGFVLNRAKGTGLGLSIARKAVIAHGGDIEVSSPGEKQGVEFIIKIPFSTVAV